MRAFGSGEVGAVEAAKQMATANSMPPTVKAVATAPSTVAAVAVTPATIAVGAAMAAALVALAFALMMTLCATQPAYALQAGESASQLQRGDEFVVDGNTYKVKEIEKDGHGLSEVALAKYGSSNKKPSISTVTYEGVTYEVEEIGKNAFNNKAGHKITSVKLGRQVDGIRAKAFYGCKKLKTIDLAKADVIDIDKKRGSYRVDDIDIGKKAFAKAGTAKVKVKCGKRSSAYRELYKDVLVKKGLCQSARVVK